MRDAHAHCQAIVLKSHSSFQMGFAFLPKKKRQALMAVYAFCRTIDDIVDLCEDPKAAEAELNRWHTRIDALYAGAPCHPITQALAPACAEFNLKQAHFKDLLKGMSMDLQYQGYQTFDDLKQYCYYVASTVGLLACEIFGYQNKQTLEYAKQLGIALQLINILRDVGQDADLDRVYLPETELAQFHLSAQDLLNKTYSDHFIAYMAFNAKRARQYYHKAYTLLPKVDRYAQRFGQIMAEIYVALLKQIETNQFRVFDHKIRLGTFQKIWIAGRVLLQARAYA